MRQPPGKKWSRLREELISCVRHGLESRLDKAGVTAQQARMPRRQNTFSASALAVILLRISSALCRVQV